MVSTTILNNGTNGILLSKIDPTGEVLYTFVFCYGYSWLTQSVAETETRFAS